MRAMETAMVTATATAVAWRCLLGLCTGAPTQPCQHWLHRENHESAT